MPSRKRIQTSQPKEVTGGDTIIVESGDVDASWEVDVVITDDPVIVSLEMPDSMGHSDLLVAGPASLDDSLDADDELMVDGTVRPDEALAFDPEPIITDLTVPDPLILVNEPPSLNPDVADFYYLHPRIADAISNVGEVVKFDPVGRGYLEIDTDVATKFRQIREDDDTFSGPVTIGNFATGVNNDIKASDALVGSGNARWVIASWDLRVGGVRWGGPQHVPGSPPFIVLWVLNEDLVSSPPFTLSAALVNSGGSLFDPNKDWTWANSEQERILLDTDNNTAFERVDGTADTATAINGPESTSVAVLEPFDASVASDKTTYFTMAAWQDATVLNALELRVSQVMTAHLQFEIEG